MRITCFHLLLVRSERVRDLFPTTSIDVQVVGVDLFAHLFL